MKSSGKQSLVQLLQTFLKQMVTGCAKCSDQGRTLQLWLVRGETVHASNNQGATGWDALAWANDLSLHVTVLDTDELPPQRTIRVSTQRLITALEHVQSNGERRRLSVPVPFHERLQNKFREVQKRVNGLHSLETHEEVRSSLLECPTDDHGAIGNAPIASGERIIVEVNPRGAKWLHQIGGQEISINGDNHVTTSDLMWAGEELRREFNRLYKEARPDE